MAVLNKIEKWFTLYKGDDSVILFVFEDENGNNIDLSSDYSEITFTMYDQSKTQELQYTIGSGLSIQNTNELKITLDDTTTGALDADQKYAYDIQFTLSSGDKETYIKGKFYVEDTFEGSSNDINSELVKIDDSGEQVVIELGSLGQKFSDYVGKSQDWAEGTDAEVTALGGEHSSKGWASESETFREQAAESAVSAQQEANNASYPANANLYDDEADFLASTSDGQFGIFEGSVWKNNSGVAQHQFDFITRVNSIQELVNVEGKGPNSRALVSGFYTQGDGGGGTFYWDASEDKANHNGIDIIDPTHSVTPGNSGWWTSENTGTGCFKRSYKGVLTAMQCGAKGTGVSSDNDTTPLQKGLDIIGGKGGGKFILNDEKEFYTTAELNPSSNTIITGKGAIVTDGSNHHNGITLNTVGLKNIVIENISIYAKSGTAGFDYAINATEKCNNVTVQNCTIDNIGKFGTSGGEYGSGIHFRVNFSTQTDYSTDIKILNNTITNIKGAGSSKGDFIYARSVDGIKIKGNYCDGCERQGIALTSYVFDFTLSDNTVKNAGSASIDLESNNVDTDDFIDGGRIYGNHLENWNTKSASSVGAQPFAVDFHTNVRNVKFFGNTCVSAGADEESFVRVNSTEEKVTIDNNDFIGTVTEHGIILHAGSGSGNVKITNNNFYDINYRAIYGDGIFGKITVSNNNIIGNTPPASQEAIRLDALSGEYIVAGNQIEGFDISVRCGAQESGAVIESLIITNNTLKGFVDQGVWLRATSNGVIEKAVIEGNIFEGNSATYAVRQEVGGGGSISRIVHWGESVVTGVSDLSNAEMTNVVQNPSTNKYYVKHNDGRMEAWYYMTISYASIPASSTSVHDVDDSFVTFTSLENFTVTVGTLSGSDTLRKAVWLRACNDLAACVLERDSAGTDSDNAAIRVKKVGRWE